MVFAFEITSFAICILSIILHTIGSCLLINLYKRNTPSTQQIYLLHLSICEGITNLIDVIRIFPSFLSISANTCAVVRKMQEHLYLMNLIPMYMVIYMTMLLMTLDRLMSIVLNIKYSNYWTPNKTKKSIIIIWSVCILASISFSLPYKFNIFLWEASFGVYFYPICNILFLLLASFTYIFMFWTYKNSQRIKQRRPRSTVGQTTTFAPNHKQTLIKVFLQSRFYISVLIILTYVLFSTIPNCIYLLYKYAIKSKSQIPWHIMATLYSFTYLSDAVIYIFMQPRVRKLLWRWMNCETRSCNRETTHNNIARTFSFHRETTHNNIAVKCRIEK